MSVPVELISLLSDGEVHSGSELAECLGVSRSAIWKQINRLSEFGLALTTIPRVGYQLSRPLELLDKTILLSSISPALVHRLDVSISQSITSTNSVLMAQPPVELISVLVAEHQTAGRGRRGRTWISPYGSNLYFSVRKEISSGVGSYDGLSLAVGVVIANVLSGFNIAGVSLKWPNDILLLGKKLGGILIEVSGDPSGNCSMVVGVGLNLTETSEMVNLIDQPWTVLSSEKHALPGRNLLLGRLISAIVDLLENYEIKGFDCYRKQWEGLNAFKGASVVATIGVQQITGVVVGIDHQGALLLNTYDGERLLHGGEISLRRGT